MSGFEVAGVVLGAIPLAISALEQYANGVQTIRSMIGYEGILIDMLLDLNMSQALFRDSCEELLQGLALPDKQFFELLESRKGWDDPSLELQIRCRMRHNFGVYKSKVQQLDRKLKTLCKKLKVKGNLGMPNLRINFWRRLRGGFSVDKHKALVSEIGNDVSRICELTEGAIKLEEGRQQRVANTISDQWDAIRSQTSQVYLALHDLWPGTCLSYVHQVHLALEAASTMEVEGEIQLSLSHQNIHHPTNPEVDFLDVTICSIECPPILQSDTVRHRTKNTPKLLEPGAHAIRAARNSCQIGTSIHNLCHQVKHQQDVRCLGYMDTPEWHHHLHDAKPRQSVRELTPLREILHREDKPRLSIKENRRYALILATAVLQLCETDWLSPRWGLRDVYLDPKEENGQLYVLKTFGDGSCLPSQILPDSSGVPHFTECLVKNQWLLALGTALLELSVGRPLECFQTDDDLDQNKKEHSLTQYMIADRLMKRINETENFTKAVGTCLRPMSKDWDFSLNNRTFRDNFYNNVIVPLKDDWKLVSKKSKE